MPPMGAQFEPDAGGAGRRILYAFRWSFKNVRRARCEIRVRLQWRLGDEIMALPVYQALCARHARCRVTVLCNYPDLLRDNPYARPVNPGAPTPDRLIDLRSGPRHVYRLAHYARRARVPLPRLRPALYYHDWHAPQLDEIQRPFIAVAPGASWPTKRWDAARWRALCRTAQDLGYTVVDLGHENEQTGVGLSFAGRTNVREAACILHAATLAVTADSGLMHLALAAGTPVLALFGPTDPDILVRNERRFHVVRSGLECRGCWNREKKEFQPGTCPKAGGPVEPGCAPCMQDITAEAVAARLRELLNS